MTTAALHPEQSIPTETTRFVVFALSAKACKLGCTTGHSQKPRECAVTARQQERVPNEITQAKRRSGLPETTPVVRCAAGDRQQSTAGWQRGSRGSAARGERA